MGVKFGEFVAKYLLKNIHLLQFILELHALVTVDQLIGNTSQGLFESLQNKP